MTDHSKNWTNKGLWFEILPGIVFVVSRRPWRKSEYYLKFYNEQECIGLSISLEKVRILFYKAKEEEK